MTKPEILRVVPNTEDVEPEDDTPKVGDFLELRVVEIIHPYERDRFGNPKKYYHFYTDADGPVIDIEMVDDDDQPLPRQAKEAQFSVPGSGFKMETVVFPDDEEDEDEDENEEPSYPDERGDDNVYRVTRWVFMAVMHVGSNYLLLQDLHERKYRVHFDKWRDRCRKVADPDARIQQSVAFWQRQLTEATKAIGELMQHIGVEGRQLAPDTQALAVQVGTGPADEHRAALEKTRKKLPDLYALIQQAGENMGTWMAARALPMKAEVVSLSERQASIDERLLAVDLYTGLSEKAKRVRKGKPADFHEKVHLMQRMHYMDEECLLDYEHGGMDFNSVGKFDRWLKKAANFHRLLPHPRCVLAFRVRRSRKERPTPKSWSAFVQIQFEEEMDQMTFLYVRNGTQLWRVNCIHDFGEELFPDFAHSTLTRGEELWSTESGNEVRTVGDLQQEHGRHWQKKVRGSYHPFNDTSVYFDDMRRGINTIMGEYNRVAVVLQGLLDRSSVLHPHPPVRLWSPADFERFVVLAFDQDRALTSGDAPDFHAYCAELASQIEPGCFTIGQQHVWWNRARQQENERYCYRAYHKTLYEDATWWWPRDDEGPGFVAEVASIRKGQVRFQWTRKGRRQKPGSDRWDDNYPTVTASIRVEVNALFNVSAYTPGDYKRFFEDPRTRAEYLCWAPYLLAAEDWHARGKQERYDLHRHVPTLKRDDASG